jgi:hypothetical protein
MKWKGMKTKALGFFCFFILALFVSTVNVDAATTLTKEYNADFHYLGQKLFSFKVTIAVQTEADGKWKFDTFYQENVTISLTSLNASWFTPSSLRVLFHSPRFYVNDTFGHGVLEAVNSSANATVGRNGTILLKYQPNSLDGGNLQLTFLIEYTIYENDQPWALEPDWKSPESISIDTEKSGAALDLGTVAPYIGVGVVIVAAVMIAYFWQRSRKSKATATVVKVSPRN